jgi:tetratricopeptide (TPR) repeat protein
MAKRWKKADITYLKRYAQDRKIEDLVERFEVDAEAIQEKLDELELRAVDSPTPLEPKIDPMMEVYERGLKALHKGKAREAAKLFARVAQESGTTDLAERGRRFLLVSQRQHQGEPQIEDEDPFARAVYERNRGNLEEALELCRRGGRQGKDERFAYLAAAIYALQEDFENAVKYLETAIEFDERNRVRAFHDPDFEALREDPELEYLFHAEAAESQTE